MWKKKYKSKWIEGDQINRGLYSKISPDFFFSKVKIEKDLRKKASEKQMMT